jgi:stage II sporulation protein D
VREPEPQIVRRLRVVLAATVAAALTLATCLTLRLRSGARGARPAGQAEASTARRQRPGAELGVKPLRIVLRRASGRPWVSVQTASGVATDPRTGKVLARLPAGELVLSADYQNQRVLVTGKGVKIWRPEVRLASRSGLLRAGSRSYRGCLLARLAGAGVQLVNEVDLERYLEGVLPGELPASFAMEAQKALAVAARTYALRNLAKHAAEGADLCDGVHCQVYLGCTNASARGRKAVRETRGLCAWYRGDLVCTFYSADCGGESTSAAWVPLKDMPREVPEYLRPVRDRPAPGAPDYCSASPSHWWSAEVPVHRIEAVLNQDPTTRIGRFRSIAFSGRDASGRVTSVRVEGLDEAAAPGGARVTREMTGWAFRKRFGPRRIKSTLMRLAEQTGDRIRITGTGSGHGLGLCQIGANGMAKPPYRFDFRHILQHYYPGVEIAPL